MEHAPKYENGRNEYGWTSDELTFPLTWDGFVLDASSQSESSLPVKSSARWDASKQQLIIRTTDGFSLALTGVSNDPSLGGRGIIFSQQVKEAWLNWHNNKVEEPESNL